MAWQADHAACGRQKAQLSGSSSGVCRRLGHTDAALLRDVSYDIFHPQPVKLKMYHIINMQAKSQLL